MSGINPQNERLKRRYYHHLREAEGRAETTIDHAARALSDFERFTASKDFKRFRPQDAIAYRNALLAGGGKRSAQLSSRATVHTKLVQVQRFFRWLGSQPGYKTRISSADVQCFSLSVRDRKIARHRREKPTPTLEQVGQVIVSMPAESDIELRDRALIACTLLTGARAAALVSLKLKHIRADKLGIEQDAREVRTKLGKSYPTFFFPVGEDVLGIFLGYVEHLRKSLFWGEGDPLFPRGQLHVGRASKFEWIGLERAHWQTTDPVRAIFRRAFAAAGLPYFSPHSFRRTLVQLGQRCCRTPEELKAWSQNLGHEEVLTSFTSYGAVPSQRQVEILSNLSNQERDSSGTDEALERRVVSLVRQLLQKEGPLAQRENRS